MDVVVQSVYDPCTRPTDDTSSRCVSPRDIQGVFHYGERFSPWYVGYVNRNVFDGSSGRLTKLSRVAFSQIQ